MNSRTSLGFISLAGGALVVLVVTLLSKRQELTKPPERPNGITNMLFAASPQTNTFKQINGYKHVSQLTAEERQTLKELFDERLKPAIDKWANAYSNRIPFDVAEVTVDTFYSRGTGGYTFMIGDTTLVIFNGRNGAKVFYMMTKKSARDLNSVPTVGKPIDLTVPITREEVLRMATADTGLKYELKDIVINPTSKFSNIDGGAEVQVGIKYKNGMMLISPDNLGFVLGKDGKLVTYQH